MNQNALPVAFFKCLDSVNEEKVEEVEEKVEEAEEADGEMTLIVMTMPMLLSPNKLQMENSTGRNRQFSQEIER